MYRCCPPRLGCNAPNGGQACALDLCRAAAAQNGDAALAIARWAEFEKARDQDRSNRGRRFRRRAFDRARDRALLAIALRKEPMNVVPRAAPDDDHPFDGVAEAGVPAAWTTSSPERSARQRDQARRGAAR
jgi:hypothetical protein